jgi:hypothetical protein
MFKVILMCASVVFLVSCSSKPILEKNDIKITRDEPSKSCQSLGPIEGRTISVKATLEQAMDALKEEAIKKGADYVQMEAIGATGTVVRGQAYNCN